MEIIPAIDIIRGKCVRLTKGNYLSKIVYDNNPLEVAKYFEDCGIQRVHIVDLDGAKSGNIVNYKVLEDIAKNTNLVIDFGGGVKTDEDIKLAFNSGASMITAGSSAVNNIKMVVEWIERYGVERIILGADVNDMIISINGWQDKSDINITDFITHYITYGIKKAICTDISYDGMLNGPSISLYKYLLNKFPDINFIASGGVSSQNDLYSLEKIGLESVIVGKAIYEQKIDLKEIVKKFNNSI